MVNLNYLCPSWISSKLWMKERWKSEGIHRTMEPAAIIKCLWGRNHFIDNLIAFLMELQDLQKQWSWCNMSRMTILIHLIQYCSKSHLQNLFVYVGTITRTENKGETASEWVRTDNAVSWSILQTLPYNNNNYNNNKKTLIWSWKNLFQKLKDCHTCWPYWISGILEIVQKIW